MRAHRGHHRLLAVVALAGAATAACSNAPANTPLPPTQVPPTIEIFSGTVPVGGISFNNFSVRRSNGQLTVTLTSAGPPANTVMGIAIGNPTGNGGCSLIPQVSATVAPGPGPHLDAGGAPAGTYCVAVGDPGTLPAAVNYSVQVTHY